MLIRANKFFPKDFFNASPKIGPSRGYSAVTRSESRKNYCLLNKSNPEIDFMPQKEIRENSLKRSIQGNGIR